MAIFILFKPPVIFTRAQNLLSIAKLLLYCNRSYINDKSANNRRGRISGLRRKSDGGEAVANGIECLRNLTKSLPFIAHQYTAALLAEKR